MEKMIRRELQLLGCPKEILDELVDVDSKERQAAILYDFRRTVLESVHREQQRLQELDYLIFQIKKDGTDCYA